jgi:hypothetical protein
MTADDAQITDAPVEAAAEAIYNGFHSAGTWAHDRTDRDEWRALARAVLAAAAVPSVAPTEEGARELMPHESLALTVALAQLHRGDEVSPNVMQVCIFALGRLAGKVDYNAEETTYRVYPTGEGASPSAVPVLPAEPTDAMVEAGAKERQGQTLAAAHGAVWGSLSYREQDAYRADARAILRAALAAGDPR